MKTILNVLIVEGCLTTIEHFLDWTYLLERKKWLSKVEVTDYTATSTTRADFKFKILLSHE